MPGNRHQKSSLTNPMYVKPVVAAGIVYAIESYYFKNQDSMASLTFGAAVAVGIIASSYVAPTVLSIVQLEDTSMYNGKTLETRIVELGCGVGASFILNKYIMNNDHFDFYTNKIGTIVVADVLSTYISEFLAKEPLEYI